MYKKLTRYFFGEQIDENKNADSYIRRPRTPARTASGAKVIHRYPKEGNFRFPVDVEEDRPRSSEVDAGKNKAETETPRKENQKEKKKEYFTNRNFAASHIPSPVFGYQQPSVKRKRPERQSSKQETTVEEPPKPTVTDQVIPFPLTNNEERHRQVKTDHEAKPKTQPKVPEKPASDVRDVKTAPRTKEPQPQSQGSSYGSPPLTLLTAPVQSTNVDENVLQAQRDQLEATLQQFQVNATVTKVTEGPSIIRFEVQPAPGVKVNKVTNLSDDLKLAMAATDLRMEAPIPGKNAIGIEVPKDNREPVVLRELFENEAFQNHKSPLAVALGLDITGSPIIMDLSSMPHGLIAGATGSGKSVCINSILVSLLYKADPEDVKLLLIDPKVVELAFYQDIPHLAAPVVTDPKEATMTLKWAVSEMERRYQLFAEAGVRDISGYNKKAEEKLSYLVIVIDELADLMMVAPQDVEAAISRIAQKARACGIHLLVATQRPSVDVITGLIKANIPTRIAFAVSSMVDSRTILDTGGAERLIGKGDMLLSENGAAKVVRLQGTFVSDQEIDEVSTFLRQQREPNYLFTKNEIVKDAYRSEEDELLEEVAYFVVEQGNASTSLIQRHFHIGYNRAARLMDMLEAKGIVSGAAGTKPRDVLVNDEQLSEQFDG